MQRAHFDQLVHRFSQDILQTLDACLPGESVFSSKSPASEKTFRGAFQIEKGLKFKNNEHASLSCRYSLCLNSTGKHLAVESSWFKIQYKTRKKPVPIMRFEYDRKVRGQKPASHFHFHTEMLPLALMFYSTGDHAKATTQSMIHYPMGGPRFRVCLEDIIELVIREFGAESQPGWEHVVQQGRKNYRAIQEETVIRQHLPRAITMLENMGYTITPPADSPELIETETPSDW